jgi:hypothetical protein
MTKYDKRVADADWAAVAAELDDYGCALLLPLLTPSECATMPYLDRTTSNIRW